MSLLGRLFAKSTPTGSPSLVRQPSPVKGYQIVYDDASRSQLDPGFEALENHGSARPDWFEYWPIRNYLRTATLDESTLYGFVSPQFYEKTRLSAAKVHHFIHLSEDADVYTFSPFPCHGATFLNVFEQGGFFTPGFVQLANAFFEDIGESCNLGELVNHWGTTVFCNYFFAKPRFWREWLRICELLREKTDAAAYSESLNEELLYVRENGESKTVQNKVFILERIASYILARNEGFKAINFPALLMPVSGTHINLVLEIYLLDELKRRYLQTGNTALLDQYRCEQKHVIKIAWPGRTS